MKAIKELEQKKQLIKDQLAKIDARIAAVEPLKKERIPLLKAIDDIDEIIHKLGEISEVALPTVTNSNFRFMTPSEKQAVRDDYATGKYTQGELAKKYSCRSRYISDIVKGMPRPAGARYFQDNIEEQPTPVEEVKVIPAAAVEQPAPPKKIDRRKAFSNEPLDTDFYDEDETLTFGDVKKICEDYAEGDSISNLAKHYKVDFSVINNICKSQITREQKIKRLNNDHPGFYEWCMNNGEGFVAEGSKHFPELIDKFYDEKEKV